MQCNKKGVLFENFYLSFSNFMPGGRARGNPAQIFFENDQKFPSTLLKNICLFDIPI